MTWKPKRVTRKMLRLREQAQKPRRVTKKMLDERLRMIAVRIIEETIVTEAQIVAELEHMRVTNHAPTHDYGNCPIARKVAKRELWHKEVEVQLKTYGEEYETLRKAFWREFRRRIRPRRPPTSPSDSWTPEKLENLRSMYAVAGR